MITKLLRMALLASTILVAAMPTKAADNSIYVQQSGDNAIVTMTQDGAGNVIRGIQGTGTDNTTPALIVGNGNTVTVNQVGTGNTVDFGIRTSVQGDARNGNIYSYAVYGNNGSASIDSNANGQNTSANNTIAVYQVGNSSRAIINVLGSLNQVNDSTAGGSNNSVTSLVNGSGNTQTITVSNGGYNNVSVIQGMGGSAAATPALVSVNNNGSATVAVVGASNTLSVTQTGGTNTTSVSITGSSNNATVTQSAVAGNTTVSLVSTGNGNTFNIASSAH